MAYINLGQVMWPVGSVYMSFSNQDPGDIFDGGWVHITGKFLYANDNTSTGGSNTHILKVNEMPAHTHEFKVNIQHGDGPSVSGEALPSNLRLGGRRRYQDTAYSTGEGQPHNNMPAYQSVYCWQRLS